MTSIEFNPSNNENISLPTVSWLLCSHVSNEHLKNSIQSCLNQTYSNFEVVFVANGPDADHIVDTVRSWFPYDSRIRIFTTNIRQLSFSLSLGLHHARGSLIARMDSDDISSPERLELQVKYMIDNPEVTVLGSSYEVINSDGKSISITHLPEDNDSIRKSLFFTNPFCHPTVIFRKEAILEVGGYLGGLHAEDYDLWLRLSLNPNHIFANLKELCLGYRVVGVGMARRSRWAYASMAASQLRNFLIGAGFRWLLASVISICKLVLRSSTTKLSK